MNSSAPFALTTYRRWLDGPKVTGAVLVAVAKTSKTSGTDTANKTLTSSGCSSANLCLGGRDKYCSAFGGATRALALRTWQISTFLPRSISTTSLPFFRHPCDRQLVTIYPNKANDNDFRRRGSQEQGTFREQGPGTRTKRLNKEGRLNYKVKNNTTYCFYHFAETQIYVAEFSP